MILYRFLTRRFGLMWGGIAYLAWRNRKQLKTLVSDVRARRRGQPRPTVQKDIGVSA
ncbi:MAG: hypothetical protein NDJ90_05345 [Oligoflexia bacterium]|nr:hypothetical protein [Oligoflexia bacterium]